MEYRYGGLSSTTPVSNNNYGNENGLLKYSTVKMLGDGARLALHVSRNEEITHLGEDDREGTVMTIREYLMLSAKGPLAPEVVAWLKKLGQMANSTIGQIMNHEETRKYLLNLHKFDPIFGSQQVFSARWVKKNLHNVSGGVSVFN